MISLKGEWELEVTAHTKMVKNWEWEVKVEWAHNLY